MVIKKLQDRGLIPVFFPDGFHYDIRKHMKIGEAFINSCGWLCISLADNVEYEDGWFKEKLDDSLFTEEELNEIRKSNGNS